MTWNSATHLRGFFASLPEGMVGAPPWRLIVADNGSTDETLEVVRELAPDATVVELGRNRGYAAGINAGIAASQASEAVLILNPDVRLGSHTAFRLYDALRQAGTGITVPRLVDPQGRLQYSLRREPTVLRAFGEALLGGRRAGRVAALGQLIVDQARYAAPGVVDWASGAVMMLSRQCADRVGEWDESFFLYSEETDYALRARDLGFAVRYVPEATAVHVGGHGDESPRLRSILVANRVRLFARHHGRVKTTAFRIGIILNEGLRAMLGRVESRAALKALLFPTKPGAPAGS